jgi:hypothetical protein
MDEFCMAVPQGTRMSVCVALAHFFLYSIPVFLLENGNLTTGGLLNNRKWFDIKLLAGTLVS